jgi:hypothetical protein
MKAKSLQSRYNSARANLLFVVIFTAINLVLLATGGDSYFIFSATVPYIFTLIGMIYSGMMPTEFYVEAELIGMELLSPTFFSIMLVLSAAMVLGYLLCWLLSGKNRGFWLTAALIAFVLDTLFLFFYYGIDVSMIVDYVLHIYVVISLFIGRAAYRKMKKEGEA